MKAPREPKAVPTLARAFSDFLDSRTLRPNTVRNHRQRIRYIADWLELPISSITKDMVQERHKSIKGDATANGVMRTLRTVLRFARFRYEDDAGDPLLVRNPVDRLSEVRAWRKDRRRKTIVSTSDLPKWFSGVFALRDSTVRDYLLFLIMTGLRRTEALSLRWRDVDLTRGIIYVSEEVEKTGRGHALPLARFTWALLRARSIGAVNEWVFPGYVNGKPLSAGFNSYRAVYKRCGVKFCLHDLRRTYITVADELEFRT
ncbi:MAG: tyrosine-type recombinase/integrase, partial [Patescibacteria group bacterium]|nr:tyrosine-type recombinase/integrase [Patescibacteria group bacterium]